MRIRIFVWSFAMLVVLLALSLTDRIGRAENPAGAGREVVILSTGAGQGYLAPCG